MCFMTHSLHQYAAGFPLAPIVRDSETLVSLKTMYQVRSCDVMYTPFHAMLVSLAGQEEEDITYWDRVDAELRSTVKVDKDPSRMYEYLWVYMSRIQLAYYADDMVVADLCRRRLVYLRTQVFDFCPTVLGSFFSGLIALRLWDNGRIYRRIARKEVKFMKGLMEKRGMNCLHRYKILEAEYKSKTLEKQKNFDEVRMSFDEAINLSTRSGVLQDAALANELMARYCSRHREHFWMSHYISHAFDLYVKWGAGPKAERILDEFQAFIDTSSFGVDTTSYTSRQTQEALLKQTTDMHSSTRRSHSDLDAISSAMSSQTDILQCSGLTPDSGEVWVGGSRVSVSSLGPKTESRQSVSDGDSQRSFPVNELRRSMDDIQIPPSVQESDSLAEEH